MTQLQHSRSRTVLHNITRYFAWLVENADDRGVVAKMQEESAQFLRCSHRMIKRYEAVLRSAGMITRERGRVVLHARTLEPDTIAVLLQRKREKPSRIIVSAKNYLSWLVAHANADGIVAKTRGECARLVYYSPSTVRRFEAVLQTVGAIERRKGFVVIKRRTIDEEVTP